MPRNECLFRHRAHIWPAKLREGGGGCTPFWGAGECWAVLSHSSSSFTISFLGVGGVGALGLPITIK